MIGLVDELLLERLVLGEVLEHEPYLKQASCIVPNRIDKGSQPAYLSVRSVRYRLVAQKRRDDLAVMHAFPQVGDESHGEYLGVLEDVGTL